MLDDIEEDIDLILGAAVSLVMFGVFVVLVVPRVDTESSSPLLNKPRKRISGLGREFIVSPVLSPFFNHPILYKQLQQ